MQGTRFELRQKGGDQLEGDRKIWKEVQPSADVQTLATVLLISSDVCQGTKGGGSCNPPGMLSGETEGHWLVQSDCAGNRDT